MTELVRGIGVLLAGILLLVGCATQDPETLPDGEVTINSKFKGLLVGYESGKGELQTSDGQRYPFTLSGFTGVAVGMSKMQAHGAVYNLKNPDDFAGKFKALTGRLVMVSGGGSRILENEKGVRIALQSFEKGAVAALGAGGFKVKLLPRKKAPEDDPLLDDVDEMFEATAEDNKPENAAHAAMLEKLRKAKPRQAEKRSTLNAADEAALSSSENAMMQFERKLENTTTTSVSGKKSVVLDKLEAADDVRHTRKTVPVEKARPAKKNDFDINALFDDKDNIEIAPVQKKPEQKPATSKKSVEARKKSFIDQLEEILIESEKKQKGS